MLKKIIWEFPLTANVCVFLFFFYFGVTFFVPGAIIRTYFLSYPGSFSPVNWLLASLYHGSLMHLLGNLSFLFVLGRAAEDKVGKEKWVLFYMMAGFLSMFFDSVLRGFMGDRHPAVGASGAISGIAAVAALLSPFTYKIKGVALPLPVFIVAWMMIYSDFMNLFADDNIAHWAHLGGFFSVLVTAYFLNNTMKAKLKTGFLLNCTFFVLTLIILFFLENR